MTLAPRVVLVHRRTERDELLARHATRGQAEFFAASRGLDLTAIEARHRAVVDALQQVGAAIPLEWRRGVLERAEVARFLFAPDDIVVVVGQDGLVANVAKYLTGQPVIGIDPEPGRNPAVLVRHRPAAAGALLRLAAAPSLGGQVEHRTMVAASTDDGRRLLALNEVYVGHRGHQTARYLLEVPPGGAPDPRDRTEHQGSSGLLVATGTGATGWAGSVRHERHSALRLPEPTEARLVWFVREAWPSPATGTSLTEGELTATTDELRVQVESDLLVAFGDGIEADALELSWGQRVSLGVAPERLHLVVDP